MPGRNDPDVLEQEAEELTRQWRDASGIEEPKAEDDLVTEGDDDTPTDPERSEEEPPDDPSETGDESAVGDDEGPDDDGSDVDELRRQLETSEERRRNAQARMTKATQEAADLRKQVGRLEGEVERLKAKPESGPDPEKADLSTLEEEYPDIVGPLVQELRNLRSEFDQSRQSAEERESTSARDEHFAKIAESHSDWEDVVGSDDFLGWIERQTPTWRRIYEGGTAPEVVEMIDRYKKDMGLSEPEPQKEEEGARRAEAERVRAAKAAEEPRVPRARKPDPNAGQKIWTAQEIDAMSLKEYERLEDEIDRAAVEGRIRG